MKPRHKRRLFIIFFALVAMALPYVYSPDAFAQEGVTSGRGLWNNFMLLVNFGILVFIFIKYARKPLANLLRSARDKIKTELDTLSGRFEEVNSARNTEADKLKGIDQRVEEIQKGFLEMGMREKEQITEQGKTAAEKMIEGAKAYSGYRMTMARKTLSDEMVDIAISAAEEGLRKGVTEEDNDKLISQFIRHLETSQQKL